MSLNSFSWPAKRASIRDDTSKARPADPRFRNQRYQPRDEIQWYRARLARAREDEQLVPVSIHPKSKLRSIQPVLGLHVAWTCAPKMTSLTLWRANLISSKPSSASGMAPVRKHAPSALLPAAQPLQGTSKNAFHGIFLDGKAKTRFSPFLHFQSLVVTENGSTFLCRSGTSIFRGALQSRARVWSAKVQSPMYRPNCFVGPTMHGLVADSSAATCVEKNKTPKLKFSMEAPLSLHRSLITTPPSVRGRA